MNNKNVFDETVETLINDAKSLQKKFTKLQEENNFRGAIDAMRLLKDTLSLIKEYDWNLHYSEYKTNGQKQVAVWEQNHSGDIRNHKFWNIGSANTVYFNRWIDKFKESISKRESLLFERGHGDAFRQSGKSYALAKLCSKYQGVVVSNRQHNTKGIENKSVQFGFITPVITYSDTLLDQYRGHIYFIDEGSGLTDNQFNELQKNNIVIGFK